MGPLGCIPGRVLLPGATTTKCFGKINAMAKNFNAGLERLVQNIPTKYPNAMGIYGIVYDTVHKMHEKPQAYGNFSFTYSLSLSTYLK